jgi:hypothetical protein
VKPDQPARQETNREPEHQGRQYPEQAQATGNDGLDHSHDDYHQAQNGGEMEEQARWRPGLRTHSPDHKDADRHG